MDDLGDQVSGGLHWHVPFGEAVFALRLVYVAIFDINIDLGFREIIDHTVLVRAKSFFSARTRSIQVSVGVAANEAGPCVWSRHRGPVTMVPDSHVVALPLIGQKKDGEVFRLPSCGRGYQASNEELKLRVAFGFRLSHIRCLGRLCALRDYTTKGRCIDAVDGVGVACAIITMLKVELQSAETQMRKVCGSVSPHQPILMITK